MNILHRHRRHLLILAILAGGGVSERRAIAAPPEAAMGTRLREDALALRERGDDAGALAKFQELDAISPSGEAKAQIGLAEQALGRWADAEKHLQLALLDTASPFVRRNRSALKAALETIGKHLATIELTDVPHEAQLSVDGGPFGDFRGGLRVGGGPHRYLIRCAGFSDTPREIACAAGETCRESVVMLPAAPPPAAPVVVEPPRKNLWTEVAPPADDSRWMRPTAFAAGGAGVAGLGIGIVFVLSREHNVGLAQRALADRNRVAYDDAASSANGARTGAIASFVLGGALLAAGTTLFFLAPERKDASKQGARSVRCAPTFPGVACGGAF